MRLSLQFRLCRSRATGAAATDAARKGAESTKDLVAKVGRARPLGEKSLGTPDAGATSLAMIFEVITEYLEK